MWKKGAGSAAGRTLSHVVSLSKPALSTVEGDRPKVVSAPALSTVEGGQSSGEGNGNGRVGTSNITFQHSRSGYLTKLRFGFMIVQDCTKEGQS